MKGQTFIGPNTFLQAFLEFGVSILNELPNKSGFQSDTLVEPAFVRYMLPTLSRLCASPLVFHLGTALTEL